MLDKLFTSVIRADIMSLLFNSPEEKFYVREIARLVNKNPSGVKRELDNLNKMNLVTSEKEGNLKYFKANRNSPLFPELKGLIAKSLGLPGALKTTLNAFDVRAAFIYGPYINNNNLLKLNLFIVSNSDHFDNILGDIEKRFGKKIKYTIMREADYKAQKKSGNAQLKKLLKIKKLLLMGKL